MKPIPRSRWFAAAVLAALAVPVFFGAGLHWGPVLAGEIRLSRLVFLAGVAAAVALVRGRLLWLTAYAVTGVVMLSVAGGGLLLSLLLLALGQDAREPAAILGHYAGLAVNIATVVPLALALVSLVPFAALETRLLRDPRGVTRCEKFLLMALRVFNHVLFDVMPDIVQAVGEEMRFALHDRRRRRVRRRPFWSGMVRLISFAALTAVAKALEYIHLWTVEISALPERKPRS